MHPLFFGRDERRLYGVLHVPEKAAAAGAVLCPPILHEYANAHRALRILAHLLADAGLAVLRFDYGCTGDSAGDGEACDVDRWVDDVGAAADELKASRGLATVGLIGLRFGATLAARAAAARGDIDSLVLWEPIARGGDYLDELVRLHRAWLEFESENLPGIASHSTPRDLVGHSLTDTLERGLRAAELAPAARPARRVLVIDESEDGGLAPVARRLEALGAAVEHARLDGGRIWRREFGNDQAQVPREILAAIVEWSRAT